MESNRHDYTKGSCAWFSSSESRRNRVYWQHPGDPDGCLVSRSMEIKHSIFSFDSRSASVTRRRVRVGPFAHCCVSAYANRGRCCSTAYTCGHLWRISCWPCNATLSDGDQWIRTTCITCRTRDSKCINNASYPDTLSFNLASTDNTPLPSCMRHVEGICSLSSSPLPCSLQQLILRLLAIVTTVPIVIQCATCITLALFFVCLFQDLNH